jgi:hypothetical protein
MRKTSFIILSIIGLFILLPACDKTKTPQEYLREEKKAIERFISREGITVLNSYPSDSIFGEKEFYKTDRGLYVHVVNPGNKRVKAYDEVLVRFDYYFDVKDYVSGDTIKYSVDYNLLPFSFIYGIAGSYDTYFGCNGWAIPLAYVGENGVVDLIIPSSLGSQGDSQSYRAKYYKNLKYTRFR